MFTHLTYKQKLKWLGAGAVLALILCYVLAIQKTIGEYSRYAQSEEAAGQGFDPGTPGSPAAPGSTGSGSLGTAVRQWMSRDQQVGLLYTRYVLDTMQSDKNLLSVASNYCKDNDLQLKEYKPVNFSKTDSTRVLTRVVTVEGRYIACLKFLFALETGKNAGRVSAAEFKSYMDTQEKKTRLDCTVYIQNLIPD
jgi:hypothetical protein